MKPFDPYGGDPILRACVERAIEPYCKLPLADVEALRNFLIVHATTHPAIAPLYEHLRARASESRSRTVPVNEEEAAAKPRAVNDK